MNLGYFPSVQSSQPEWELSLSLSICTWSNLRPRRRIHCHGNMAKRYAVLGGHCSRCFLWNFCATFWWAVRRGGCDLRSVIVGTLQNYRVFLSCCQAHLREAGEHLNALDSLLEAQEYYLNCLRLGMLLHHPSPLVTSLCLCSPLSVFTLIFNCQVKHGFSLLMSLKLPVVFAFSPISLAKARSR